MNFLTFKISKPEIFSFDECLWFLDRGFDESLHSIFPNEIRKAININGRKTIFSITESDQDLVVRVFDDESCASGVKLFIEDWFDLKTNLVPFYERLRIVPELCYMADKYQGLRMVGIPDLFESLCWCIMGQQINLKFAYSLKRSFVEGYGDKLEFEDSTYWTFPDPEVVAGLSIEELRKIKFSKFKSFYIIEIAKAFVGKEISKESLQILNGKEEKLHKLMKLPGIGPWTANYTLMKSLKELTALPVADIGIINALLNHGLIKDRKEESIKKVFRIFEGYESYLVFYLWRSLREKKLVL